MAKVGEEDPCDWCGRPGTVRQHDYYELGGVLLCRNPSLCDVYVVLWQIPGDVGDAFLEAGVDVPETVEGPLEAALFRKWREKVELGSAFHEYLTGCALRSGGTGLGRRGSRYSALRSCRSRTTRHPRFAPAAPR